ncbi:LuxR C-terminal-related transcriptional regulator [uncultured Imperialibacter sp.]|uniref:response regulator transcription factor n=1 Tax=uncultured Imperialibacter sp. TaxID=1672639 RepID=UPI0030DA7B90
MTRTIVIYGLSMAALLFLLKLLEYRFFVRDLSLEIYVGAVALLFVLIGVWAGGKIIGKRRTTVIVQRKFHLNEDELRRLEISQRELQVLQLMAEGFSNQEIADKLFISLSTVKTHTANLFSKLDSRRRTQAVQKAKELSLIQ